ncbi:hypothetical protein AB6802_09250 [Mesorhizobium sp. RCC_202]|uniref:hypothetical protein n=1 Tax=Mesorhizobium sp. RCC_202 TaxID=3239222 RepID=UPI0035238476
MRKALFTAAMFLLSALPAAAQTADQPQVPQDCQAQPDSNNGGNGAQKQDGQQSDNLSGSLQPCGGVLKPPPTGDDNATQPPADGSQMPVIKPGQVPPQTSK